MIETMEAPPSGDITQLLHQWRSGKTDAFNDLITHIYDELHGLASRAIGRERAGHTLQPTALVNEVYMRLASRGVPDLESRRHFYGVAARLMRQILVDHARKHLSQKRGQGVVPVALDENLLCSRDTAADFAALDQALTRLEQVDKRKARAVELRFFTGLTVEETAEVLGVSVISVYRHLAFATAFLSRELSQPLPRPS